MSIAKYLKRPVKVYLYANGALVFGKSCPKGALPVFSVDTAADAESIQVSLCSLSRADNETYILPFTGEIEHMNRVTTMLDAFYRNQKAGLKGEALWEPMAQYKRQLGLTPFSTAD